MTILKQLRQVKKMTQIQLADKIGLGSSSLLCRIERRQVGTYPKLRRQLSEVLGVSEQELFDSQGFAKPAS